MSSYDGEFLKQLNNYFEKNVYSSPLQKTKKKVFNKVEKAKIDQTIKIESLDTQKDKKMINNSNHQDLNTPTNKENKDKTPLLKVNNHNLKNSTSFDLMNEE